MTPRASTWQDHHDRVGRVLRHVERHLDAAPDLPALASLACLSEFHFHRVFRAVTGESVLEHVRRLRLERAARRLRRGDAPIVDLALEAGFGSHEAFTRAFASRFGVPPSAYRSAHRAPEPRSAPDPRFARVERRPASRVACLRHVGPYDRVGRAWSQLFAWAGRQGIAPAGAPIGLCWDDPDVTPAPRVRYDACLPIAADATPGDDVRVAEIEAGEFAVAVHRGPLARLGESYGALVRWMLLEGHDLGAEPSVEQYLRNPADTPPEDLETVIAIRIQ